MVVLADDVAVNIMLVVVIVLVKSYGFSVTATKQ
jgi:hypothetical protein